MAKEKTKSTEIIQFQMQNCESLLKKVFTEFIKRDFELFPAVNGKGKSTNSFEVQYKLLNGDLVRVIVKYETSPEIIFELKKIAEFNEENELEESKKLFKNLKFECIEWLKKDYQHEFVKVEEGIYKVGNEYEDENIPKKIKVRQFYIAKYLVTQENYEKITSLSPSRYKNALNPVECVDWIDAIRFCNNLSKKEGLIPCYKVKDGKVKCDFNANGYRLPTDAEWEIAARGGKDFEDTEIKNFGDFAWYEKNSNDTTHNVGLKKANDYGLFDMLGNVCEWCWNEKEVSHFIRGGSYDSSCNVYHRMEASYAVPSLGFRLVRSTLDCSEENFDCKTYDYDLDDYLEISPSAQNLFNAYKTYMDLSTSNEERTFVKEMIEKYCKEYNPSDVKNNNKLGVMMLHYNGCNIFPKYSKEIRTEALKSVFNSDYIKNYLHGFNPVNNIINNKDEYKKKYHIFSNEIIAENETSTKENIKNIIEILKEKTSKIVYEMDFDEEKEAGVFDSKLLGLPYWNTKMEYPKDKDGNKMVFMGQINFSHEKIDNDLLPKSGILQFFHPNNDFEWDEKDYKLIYHKDSEIDFNYTEENAKSLNLPEPGEYCYITKELPFSLVKSTSIINASCNEFEDYVKNAINQLIAEKKFVYSESLPENEDVDFYYDELFEELIEVIYESDEDCNCTSSMLGYPAFTQDDPREDEETEYYDTLLLKLDSAGNDNICIGDCGIVNIFINNKDLKNLKFDNTFYTWDCY